jgi:3-oxoisoapionate decarboxylase
MKKFTHSRRNALQILTASAASLGAGGLAAAPAKTLPRLPLGLDGHAMRGMKWKALAHIKYAGSQKLDAVLFNGPHYFESLENNHLRQVKAAADAAGLKIYFGAGGIAEGAKSYKNTFGSGAGTLRAGLRIAQTLGAPTVNCRIGNIDDRFSEGGIKARLAEAARSLKAVRSEARDKGLRFAFENHAGDTRSSEILELIHDVGPDVCGVMLDPGNAVWSMEDPMKHLAALAPHVFCTSVRDYHVWDTTEGAEFQWAAIGRGMMDVKVFTETLRRHAPGVPFFVESITDQPRPIPYLKPEFLAGFPGLKVTDIRDFLELSRRGRQPEAIKFPTGNARREFQQRHQRQEFEDSIRFLRDLASK